MLRSRPLRALFLLFSMLPAGAVVASAQAPAQGDGTAVAAASRPAPSPAQNPVDLIGSMTEPADGKWLTDPEGLQYFIKPLEKDWIIYKHVDENTIRLRGGPWYEVASEDDTTLYLKIYRPGQRRSERPDPGRVTPERSAEVAASYRVEVPEADALRFVPFDQGLPRQGMWRDGFDLADMNGDGHLDLVHGPPRRSGSYPLIYLGDSQGGWTLWQDTSFPSAPYDYGDAAAADFDGDGHTDLALGMHMRGVLVLRGDGKGGFTKWSEGIELERPGKKDATAFSSRALETTDWDGDGDIDLLVLAEGPRGFEHVTMAGGYGRVVYLNQGDGSWVKQLDSSRVYGSAIALGDFDGDKRLDFANATNVGGFRSLLNLGREDGSWESVEVPPMRRGLIWSLAAGDFDRNGRSDLVAGYYGSEARVRRAGIDALLSQEDGSWTRLPLAVTEQAEGSPLVHYTALAVGDLDGDGALDVVGSTRDGMMRIFRGDGQGGFIREIEAELEAPQPGCDGYHIELADLDGDGRDEVVASFAGEPCPTGGSIRAWRTQSVAVSGAASSAATDATPGG